MSAGMRQTACALLVTALAVAPVAACAHEDEREATDFERMRVQQRYDPYGPSGVFRDGKVMQEPPAGTLPRGGVALASSYVPTLAAPAAVRDSFAAALAVTPALLREGADRFRIYCAVCHGPAGYGGSLVAANMGPPRPPSLHSPRVRALTPAQIFAVVSGGFGRMPAYAFQLTDAQRWAVVAYVRELQHSPPHDAAAVRDSTTAAALDSLDAHAKSALPGTSGAAAAAAPPGSTSVKAGARR
ncbi:MAG TPA: cytochrome c [Gemmatimonadaceae bacterium]|nr:cytochrome c [Gemmatimonadaceae bacterium]